MAILSDRWIRRMAQDKGMIEPFVDGQKRDGVISYGLSSYGYDARVGNDFKIFTNVNSAVVDPKNFAENSFVDRTTDICIIPPNSFALARTVEYFRIPRDVLVICVGKSTYARCGIIVNVTPLEPEWEGHVTLEFSNTTPLPARIYANEGACPVPVPAGQRALRGFLQRQGRQVPGPARRHLAEDLSGRKSMDRIRIKGGRQLKGELRISGSKNASLPLMVAALLSDKKLTLHNVPRLADITTMIQLLQQHGVEIQAAPGENGHAHGTTLILQAGKISSTTAPYDIVRKMRASVLVLGPLLAREGVARVSLPGGCAIGARPVDLHIAGLKAMGAEIDIDGGYMVARAPKGLKGARYTFPKVSVGATENLMMAAALAKGTTVLDNAAREPEITDLAKCLVAMGVPVGGVGTETLTIEGVSSLKETAHSVIPDRIETGTYAMAVAMTAGDVELVGGRLDLIETAAQTLRSAGVTLEQTARGLRVQRTNGALRGVDVMTEPYPGFPTDLQAQMMALMTRAEGASMITETVFESRFMHVPELSRMGANVTIHHESALVRGVRKLRGADVMATDLRASVSLAIAALAAEGDTTLHRVYHLDRGYERLEEKLGACGADIERLKG